MVHETYEADVTVSLVARRNGVQPSQLFCWRKLAAQGALTATSAQEEVVALAPRDHLAGADLRLGDLDRGSGAQAGVVPRGPRAVETDQRRARLRPHHRVAALATGADQDRCAPECAVTPMCCNTFPFDIGNRSVLFRTLDGESALESSLSPLR